MAFGSRRGIPKGLEIRLSVTEAAGTWRIACQVVAQDGQSRSVGDVIRLDSMSGLPVAVATFDPRSFTHIIEAFAEELELDPSA